MRKALFIALALALVATYAVPTATEATTLQSGTLIKGESFTTVYYFGADGKRYVFPNSKTYFTWFDDFNTVITITDSELGAILIGGNVIYKPNSRLVKITTDPKTYWVGNYGKLHHVTTETIAKNLFGTEWNKRIDDVPDAFFTNYSLGEPIDSESLPSYTATTTINKNLGLSDEPDPVYAGDGTITLGATANGSTVDLDWTMSGMTSPKGFKVVKNTTGNPVYPGDAYHYLSDPNAREDTWTGLANGTYYFRVCEYLGGSCGVYSNQVAVTVEGGSTSDGEIALTASTSGDTVNLSWSVTGIDTTNGFKIVKNTTGSPVYPGDSYVYKSSPTVRSYSWSGLSAGTYYFRVCEYLGGSCGVYSNQVEVAVEGVTSSGGTIDLDGTVDGTTINLSWTLTDMTSDGGFKIVKNTTGSPVYPGDTYHYEGDPDSRTDIWKYMDPGTYYFRVCEYLGGSCGVYSNQVELTVE
ncbi:hypothetical protein GWN26_11875 [Candidatus Saccharibacteria bacterium]|nr:hypothetical protein [Candidatus Saccharibacteria bacterium]NIV04197.1 hypothetical protein [Calditrichia bacterium]NIS37851.1 hypothetical protein [Candidatus Saccharibacteria bacterium]NIV72149.1 hypothetical protein [Calditrichia bacterium]NIV99778.1 hypothetical protein [Candidatus Saccharibacteria bacterium]